MKTLFKNKPGFTLTEVLLGILSIVILVALAVLAIDPGKMLGDTRNAERKSNVNLILSVVSQYNAENKKTQIAIPEKSTEICKTGATSCSGLIDLTALTTSGKYLKSIPVDPLGSSGNGTGYFISKSVDGHTTVFAPHAEQDMLITATR
ncbi:MAG: hypothetical protein WCT53_00200 [Candidatus Gracilibacteria bacterium]